MSSKVSKAMAGKMARACDSCIRKQARWYCAADDAFLCQSCDGSVHSANLMARRHERVRLKGAPVEPSWTTGFTKKARTPRRKAKYEGRVELVDDRVPELGGDETTSYDELSEEQEQEQNVMYRVPFIGNENDVIEFDDFGGDVKSLSLLGFDMDLVNYGEESNEGFGSGRVKMEKQEMEMDVGVNEVDMEREAIFEVNYDGHDPLMLMKESSEEFEVGEAKKNVLLALDYEGVIAAWADDRSPWTTGDRPEVQPNHNWPDLGGNGGVIYYAHGDTTNGRTCGLIDGGREARVSRYREKRRNRLFSKKIRYEVRKLNAEKRPRMKGRFVKKSSFAPTEPCPT